MAASSSSTTGDAQPKHVQHFILADDEDDEEVLLDLGGPVRIVDLEGEPRDAATKSGGGAKAAVVSWASKVGEKATRLGSAARQAVSAEAKQVADDVKDFKDGVLEGAKLTAQDALRLAKAPKVKGIFGLFAPPSRGEKKEGAEAEDAAEQQEAAPGTEAASSGSRSRSLLGGIRQGLQATAEVSASLLRDVVDVNKDLVKELKESAKEVRQGVREVLFSQSKAAEAQAQQPKSTEESTEATFVVGDDDDELEKETRQLPTPNVRDALRHRGGLQFSSEEEQPVPKVNGDLLSSDVSKPTEEPVLSGHMNGASTVQAAPEAERRSSPPPSQAASSEAPQSALDLLSLAAPEPEPARATNGAQAQAEQQSSAPPSQSASSDAPRNTLDLLSLAAPEPEPARATNGAQAQDVAVNADNALFGPRKERQGNSPTAGSPPPEVEEPLAVVQMRAKLAARRQLLEGGDSPSTAPPAPAAKPVVEKKEPDEDLDWLDTEIQEIAGASRAAAPVPASLEAGPIKSVVDASFDDLWDSIVDDGDKKGDDSPLKL